MGISSSYVYVCGPLKSVTGTKARIACLEKAIQLFICLAPSRAGLRMTIAEKEGSIAVISGDTGNWPKMGMRIW